VQGERKQVTVMFTDVSGFTAMSERLDPEEVHGIMDHAAGEKIFLPQPTDRLDDLARRLLPTRPGPLTTAGAARRTLPRR
jgi:hypothetical protein